MTWEDFLELYSANFRPLTARDGVSEWRKFVASVKGNDVLLLRNAMIACGRYQAQKRIEGEDPMAPRIPDIALRMKLEKANLAERAKHTVNGCDLCRGTRHLVTVAPSVQAKHDYPLPVSPEYMAREDFNGFMVWECPGCTAQYTPELAAALAAAGVPDSEPSMLLFERLGRMRTKEEPHPQAEIAAHA